MIQVSPQMRILVAVESIDFRAGIDRIARICKQELQADPHCGWLFVFRNRRRTAIRVLSFDGQGFWMCHKRLSSGKFRYWPQSAGTQASTPMQAHELQVLLMAGDPTAVNAAPAWRPLK